MVKCTQCEQDTAGNHALDCPTLIGKTVLFPENAPFQFIPETPTVRQFFAAHALQGIISNADTMREITRKCEYARKEDEFFEIVAAMAYLYADAMIEVK